MTVARPCGACDKEGNKGRRYERRAAQAGGVLRVVRQIIDMCQLRERDAKCVQHIQMRALAVLFPAERAGG